LDLIKVNIQSGEVRENRTQEYWVREPVYHYPQSPALRPAPQSHPGKEPGTEKADPELMARVQEFRSNVKRLSNSWEDNELYRLAALISHKKMSVKQAAYHLGRTPDACKYMLRRLKSAGVI